MRRVFAFLPVLMLLTLLVATCTPREPLDARPGQLTVRFVPETLPSAEQQARYLAPFTLEGAWRMDSRHFAFGGFSSLAAIGPGRLLSASDTGFLLQFSPPGSVTFGTAPDIRPIRAVHRRLKASNDAESLAFDPVSGRAWIGWEGSNAMSRLDRDLHKEDSVRPRAMRHWLMNAGAEAMARLADGRFIVLNEGNGIINAGPRHEALLFSGDPLAGSTANKRGKGPRKPAAQAGRKPAADNPVRFTFITPDGYSPTDMAPLPDGRVLILLRRLAWLMPPRFSGLIMVADPGRITAGGDWHGAVVARLDWRLRVDNFEGLAIQPRNDGRVTVWLISDNNGLSVVQRTLLWQLSVNPRDLPR